MESELAASLTGSYPGFQNFWRIAISWWATMTTEVMLDLQPLDCEVPDNPASSHALVGAVACGAYADSVMVQESTRRLAQLLPGSKFAYIPQSKSLWALEGVSQSEAVAALVNDIVPCAVV